MTIQTLRKVYHTLLGLYPKAHRERYAEGMMQTMNDLLAECNAQGRSAFSCAFWIFAETSVNIFTTHWRTTMIFKQIVRLALVVAGLLLIPLVAMQFTNDVAWSVSDFIAMAVLLFGSGLLFIFATRHMVTTRQRVATGLAVFTGFFLVWLNLAVGLIGSENNPANELYGAVLIIALVGAAIARFQPKGLAIVMLATAAVQFLVPIVAFMIWHANVTGAEGFGVAGVFLVNGFFVALWLAAAWLFRDAQSLPGLRRTATLV